MKRINFWTIAASALVVCAIVLLLSAKHCDECYSPPVMAVKVFFCGLVIIGFTLYYRWQFKEHEGIVFEVESLPLGQTDGVVEGVPFAGTGTIASENGRQLMSPYANKPCVYFHSIKEKYVRQGKSSRWVVVENIARFVPFHLKDERGEVNIDLTNIDDDFSGFHIDRNDGKIPDPRHSEIDCAKVLRKTPYSESDGKFLGILLSSRYRRSESIVEPGTAVFVCGMGAKAADGQICLREDARCPLIITTKTRDRYVEEFYKGSNVLYLSFPLIALGFSLSFWAANYFLMVERSYFYAALFFVDFMIMGGMIFGAYNRIVSLRNRALGALSNIEVELKRRADLIPNLAAVVDGYSQHEQNLQEFIAQARAQISFSKVEPQNKTSVALPVLAAVAEKYPELKASDNFRALMLELGDTEGRIADSREFYNRTTQRYDTLIQQFPFLVAARIFDFKEMQFVSIARGA